MDLKTFRETLLEFLGEVTVIPDERKRLFVEGGIEKFVVEAPNDFYVLGQKMLIKRRPEIENEGEYWYGIKVFTAEHQYSISAVYRKDRTYLGCTVMTRKHRAGEDWTRGNDLPDGKLNRETWNWIKSAIVRYELEYLSKYITNGHFNKPTPKDTPSEQKEILSE